MLSTVLSAFCTFLLYPHNSIKLLLSPPISSEEIEAWAYPELAEQRSNPDQAVFARKR